MPSNSTRGKRFAKDLVSTRAGHLIDALSADPVAETTPRDTPEVKVSDLWLDDQPRQIVPEEDLEHLVAEGKAQPAALLATLRAVASDPYFAEVLAQVEELAANIRINGVLTPILVAQKGERLVVRDGHRRSLAAIVAERSTLPYHIVDEPSDFVAMGRQFAVNSVRVDFTALDQARWLFRMARQAEASLRTELGMTDDGSVVEVLVGQADLDDEDDSSELTWRNLSAPARELARRIREQVCEVTGLGERHYQRLLALNRLTPAARAAGRRLSEGQLRPVTHLALDDQVTVTAFIARQGLGSREAATLAKVVRSGDRDAVQRVMARLAKEEVTRQRVSISFEALLHAIPEDFPSRCAALHAELQALSDELRAVRLRTMREQSQRARGLIREFEEMLALFGSGGESD